MSERPKGLTPELAALPVEQQGALIMYVADRASLNLTWIAALVLVFLYGASLVLLQTLPASSPHALEPTAHERLMTIAYIISGITVALMTGYVALKTRRVRLMRQVALKVGTPDALLARIDKLSIRELNRLALSPLP